MSWLNWVSNQMRNQHDFLLIDLTWSNPTFYVEINLKNLIYSAYL